MLGVKDFHHMTHEVLSVEATARFYKSLFGFEEVARPNLRCRGVWLDGHGLHLHLIEAQSQDKFAAEVRMRKESFGQQAPFVDHIAFLCDDLDAVEAKVATIDVRTVKNVSSFGATQLFLLDPDGRVVEIANCAPQRGEITCVPGAVNS